MIIKLTKGVIMFAAFILRGPSMRDNQYNIDHYSYDKKKALSLDFKKRCDIIWSRFSNITGGVALVMSVPVVVGVCVLINAPLAGTALLIASVAVGILCFARHLQASSQSGRWEQEYEFSTLSGNGSVDSIITKCKEYHHSFKFSKQDDLYWELNNFFKKNPLNPFAEDPTKKSSFGSKQKYSMKTEIKLHPFVMNYIVIKKAFEAFQIARNHPEKMLLQAIKTRKEMVPLKAELFAAFCKTQRSFAEFYDQKLKQIEKFGLKGEHLLLSVKEGMGHVVTEEGLQYLEQYCSEFVLQENAKTEELEKTALEHFEKAKNDYLTHTIKKHIEALKAAFASGDGQGLEQQNIPKFEYQAFVIPEVKVTIVENLSLGITQEIVKKLNADKGNDHVGLIRF